MKTMLSSALFAGVAAGLLGALLQFLLVQPDIVLAERYEAGELVHFQGVDAQGHDHSTHDHGTVTVAESPDSPAADAPSVWQRQAFTVLFSLFTWCGFGLALSGGMRATEAMGHAITRTDAVLWGLGGFLAFQMMPALGLAPELPGTPGGDLQARQVWWLATVLASGMGLWFLAYGRGVWPRVAGAGVLALPQIWGAPQAEAMGGVVPPELAASFAAHSLGAGLLTWAVLGLASWAFWRRETAP